MLRHLFSSLRHRDFRIYYIGQLVSITGTWMQSMAQAWLVYRLTGSSTILGLVAFAGLFPVLLLGLPAGALADRFPRRRLLIHAQLLAMVQAFTLAWLVLSGLDIQVWEIVGLALLLGVVHAIEMPTRHAFLAELVAREDLPNAIALNSSLFNLARFVGPAIAGWLIAAMNEGMVFLINGVTFAVVLVGLLLIPSRPRPGGSSHRRSLSGGIHFAWHHREVRPALLLLAAVSLAGTAYTVLMPVFARTVFGGSAETLGHLLGAAGGGAFVAALRLAYLSGRQPLQRQMAMASMSAGSGMLGLASIDQLWPAFPLLALLGFSLTTLVASTNTLLQIHTPHELRGRVMALFSVLFIGLTSVGNLLAGSLADRIQASGAVAVLGTMSLLGGALYWRHLSGNDRNKQGY